MTTPTQTAADKSKDVAGVAKDEAQQVTQEAKQQARGLVDEAMTQVDDQSRAQRDRLVEKLRTFSDDLDHMADQGERPGVAADLSREIASRARDLCDQVDGREPRELLDEVRGFARRRPGTFLLGALAAGVVAGRLGRGAKQAHDDGDQQDTTATGYAGPRPTYPAAPPTTGSPTTGSPVAGEAGAYPDTPLEEPGSPTVGSTRTSPGPVADDAWTDEPPRRMP